MAERQRPTIAQLVESNDDTLLCRVISCSSHSLHKLLPDRTSHGYQLRQRPHDRILAASDDTRNFIHRLLLRNVYWPWSSHHWTLYITFYTTWTVRMLQTFFPYVYFFILCLNMVAVCQPYNKRILYYCIILMIYSWKEGYESCRQSKNVFVISSWDWNRSEASGCWRRRSRCVK